MPIPRDTHPEAGRVVLEILGRKTLAERQALLDQEFATARMLARSGLRWRHPGASAAEIEARFYRLLLGDDLGERVWAARQARRTAGGTAAGAHGTPAV